MSAPRALTFGGLFGHKTKIAAASLDRLAERVVQERETAELYDCMKQSQTDISSSTTVVEHAQPPTKKRSFGESTASTTVVVEQVQAPAKKRVGGKAGSFEDWSGVVAPPILLPNNRKPGGGAKSDVPATAERVLRVLYDDAKCLGEVLAAFDKFMPFLHFVFNEDGMRITMLHSSKTVQVELFVPMASFFRFENLVAESVYVVLSSAAVKRMGSAALKAHSLIMMYDQNGMSTEPLHVLLNPRDNLSSTAQSWMFHLPHSEDENDVQHCDHAMQYRVRMDAALFLSNVRQLAKTSTVIVLMLRGGNKNAEDGGAALSFEMGGLSSGDSFDSAVCHVEHAPAPTKSQCVIERIDGADEAVSLKEFSNHRLLAPVLESVASFASTSAAEDIVIEMGVSFTNGTLVENPVHVNFPMRPHSQAPFTVEAWMATKLVDI